jgi:hypothetical protein
MFHMIHTERQSQHKCKEKHSAEIKKAMQKITKLSISRKREMKKSSAN